MNSSYRSQSWFGFFSAKYALNIFIAALLVIHIPLIVFSVYFLVGKHNMSPLTLLLILLFCTLVSTALIFVVVKKLQDPLVKATEALEDYLKNRKVRKFPKGNGSSTDDLFSKIQFTIEALDATLNDKKDLVSLLSHDVRTPLAQVIGMCSLIQLTEDKDEIKEYCQILIDEMGNQLNFLEQVVRMNRLDNMEAAFSERSSTSVSELVDRAMHTLNIQTTEKPIEWQFQIEKNLAIQVNPHLFAQALQNVIGNAIKFSNQDSVILIRGKKEKNSNIIEVQDHGMGFLPEDSLALFDRFTSKGKTGTMGEKSNGIGLYLTRNIIERHDGKIEAFSEGPGHGSTFRITIPS